jgi:hypothetical protein
VASFTPDCHAWYQIDVDVDVVCADPSYVAVGGLATFSNAVCIYESVHAINDIVRHLPEVTCVHTGTPWYGH